RFNGSAALSRPSSSVSKEAVSRGRGGRTKDVRRANENVDRTADPSLSFAQTYRPSTRPGRVSINAGLQIPDFLGDKIRLLILLCRFPLYRPAAPCPASAGRLLAGTTISKDCGALTSTLCRAL